MLENEIRKIIREELEEIKLLFSENEAIEKSIYSLKELPFSKVSAYKYEKEGRLKITRPNGPGGMAYVRKIDLDAFLSGQQL